MTQQTRANLKAKFEDGDIPSGTDYSDLIDSSVFLSDTTAQSLSSPLTVAGALGASTAVSAPSVEASSATITGTVSAASGFITTLTCDQISGSAANFTRMSAANVSANALGITGSLVWTAEVTASVISTGQQTITGLVVNKFIIVNVSGQTVGIPTFKVA